MVRYVPRRLALLSVAHFSIDGYSSFVPPLLPLLISKLDFSLGEVGSLLAISSIASSFSQPLFGWAADRLRRAWFVAFGPLVTAVFLSSVGLAYSYGMLVTLMFLGGLGAAAFHPQAATLATETAKRRGLALSAFVSSGTLGFALGPLFAVSMVAAVGLERSWIAAVPGLLIAALLLFWFQRATPRPHSQAPKPAFRELKPVAKPLTLLYFCVVFRSAASFGFMTYLPIWLNRQGYSIQAGGAVLTAYLAAGALGGFFGGWLAERIGGRRIVIQSFVGAIPLFYGFLLLPEPANIASLVLGSFVLQGSLPVNVVLGQELSPRHSSTIASLLMGAAWGFGMLLVGPTGALADAQGLRLALGCLALTMVAGLACAWGLPDIRRAPVRIPSPDFVDPAVAAKAP